MKRFLLSHHQSYECATRYIECEYKKYGCSAVLTVMTMGAHLTSTVQHCSLLKQGIIALESKVNDLETKLADHIQSPGLFLLSMACVDSDADEVKASSRMALSCFRGSSWQRLPAPKVSGRPVAFGHSGHHLFVVYQRSHSVFELTRGSTTTYSWEDPCVLPTIANDKSRFAIDRWKVYIMNAAPQESGFIYHGHSNILISPSPPLQQLVDISAFHYGDLVAIGMDKDGKDGLFRFQFDEVWKPLVISFSLTENSRIWASFSSSEFLVCERKDGRYYRGSLYSAAGFSEEISPFDVLISSDYSMNSIGTLTAIKTKKTIPPAWGHALGTDFPVFITNSTAT
jgi:hypothetical protein